MNYYEEIKAELMNNEVYKRIKDCSKNRSDLSTYYKVGKLLNDAGKNYGEEIIKKYSDRLLTDVGKIYTKRTLFRIRQFYIMFSNKKMWTLLSWNYYVELLSLNDVDFAKNSILIKNSYYKNISEKILQKLILENIS